MDIPLDGTLALVDTKLQKPKSERKGKTMWNDVLTQLFLTHRYVLRAEFDGKNSPAEGFKKVYAAMCGSNLQLVQAKNLTPTALASKWKIFKKSVKDYSDYCNRTGADNSEPKPPYHDEIMDCLGAEGQVAVKGLRIGRDSSAGTHRVGYWSADNLLDSQYPDYVPQFGKPWPEEIGGHPQDAAIPEHVVTEEHATTERHATAQAHQAAEQPIKDDETEDDDVKEIPAGVNKDTPTKRMSKRQRIAEKATSTTDKLITTLQDSFQILNTAAEGRFRTLQEEMREERGQKAAANLSLLKVEHEQRDKEFGRWVNFCKSTIMKQEEKYEKE